MMILITYLGGFKSILPKVEKLTFKSDIVKGKTIQYGFIPWESI
jgi:hypothetical protein